MPNWCDNRLAISGPPAVVMELVGKVAGEQPFDFEALLPTPPHLLTNRGRAPGAFPDWYEWRRAHWGVKWNADAVRRQGYGRSGRVRYRFLTPYGPPIAFLDRVAELWPEVAMELAFEVELMGGGSATWQAGALSRP